MSEYVPLAIEQIEAFVEKVIEANSVWPDPLSSQVPAVMDVLVEAMAQAWDEGHRGLCRRHGVVPFAACRNPYDPTTTQRRHPVRADDGEEQA